MGKSNFEALVDRHGQNVLWRMAKKCTCVTANNRADLDCPKCKGRGDAYSFQREYEDVFRATVRENIIELPEEYTDAEALEVYDARGVKFEFSRYDNFIQIENWKVKNNELVDVRVRVPIVRQLENVTLEKVGGGYYRVPGILTEPSKFEGVHYQTAGDVLFAADAMDDEGNPVNILEYRRDAILTDSEADIITARAVEYIMPFKFIVLSQNFSKSDAKFLDAHSGDAICTFPYMYNLAEHDILTVLSGTVTSKEVWPKTANTILPKFFVAQVDSLETKTSAYTEGVDFILVGTNEIHWIGNQPEDGEMMSITYRYYPTYRVATAMPTLRTSEDQRIPRKVMLKLFTAYNSAVGVNLHG
jgi:hypothetical protein